MFIGLANTEKNRSIQFFRRCQDQIERREKSLVSEKKRHPIYINQQVPDRAHIASLYPYPYTVIIIMSGRERKAFANNKINIIMKMCDPKTLQ